MVKLLDKFRRKASPDEEEEDFESSASGADDLAAYQQSSVASHGVLSVGGKQYAVGLLWHPLSGEKSPSKEAKDMAKMPGVAADFFCLRTGANSQFGLGTKERDHKSGMPSLAAHLADSEPGSWVGCFHEGDQYYLVAVRDDLILPEIDKVCFSEEEAKHEFAEVFFQANDWKKSFAPASWEIDETKEASLSEVLAGKPTATLREVDNTKNLVRIGIGIGLLLLLMAGGSRLLTYFDSSETQENIQQMFQTAQKTVVAPITGGTSSKEPVAPPPPWEGKSTGISFIVACVTALKNVDLTVPGWNVETVTCTKDSSVVLKLSRAGGTINWVTAYLNRRPGVKATVGSAGTGNSGATATYPLSGTAVYPRELQTAHIRAIRTYLGSQLDEVGVDFRIEAGTTTLTEEERNFYDALKVGITSSVDPVNLVTILARVPAFVIEQITLDVKEWKWNIEGLAYEKFDKPNVTGK
jgi:hypothetical protein